MTRLYTPALANSALPLVRAIVTDIVRLEQSLADVGSRYQQLREADDVDRLALDDARRAVAQIAHEREECEEELDALAVRLDDAAEGSADFPSEMNGEDVFLCWRLGEDSVTHYHGRDEGFAFRRALPEAVVTTTA